MTLCVFRPRQLSFVLSAVLAVVIAVLLVGSADAHSFAVPIVSQAAQEINTPANPCTDESHCDIGGDGQHSVPCSDLSMIHCGQFGATTQSPQLPKRIAIRTDWSLIEVPKFLNFVPPPDTPPPRG